jgi:hypothetical protein
LPNENDVLKARFIKRGIEIGQEEKIGSAPMDGIRRPRAEIVSEEEDRHQENSESVEANDWSDLGQGSPTGCVVEHA